MRAADIQRMQRRHLPTPFALATLLYGVALPAFGDTVQARCDVYPKGSDKATASLACSFPQRPRLRSHPACRRRGPQPFARGQWPRCFHRPTWPGCVPPKWPGPPRPNLPPGTSAGSGSCGSLLAFNTNKRRSLSDIVLPALSDMPGADQACQGHDQFAVVESTLVRRFPVYREGDDNAAPSGGVRKPQYNPTPGAAMWCLVADCVAAYLCVRLHRNSLRPWAIAAAPRRLPHCLARPAGAAKNGTAACPLRRRVRRGSGAVQQPKPDPAPTPAPPTPSPRAAGFAASKRCTAAGRYWPCTGQARPSWADHSR